MYVTEGSENVSALGGAHHDYPSETTITVTTTDCGVQFRWDVLEERYEQWEVCAAAGVASPPSYTSFHNFFGQPDLQRYVCDNGSDDLPRKLVVGASWKVVCASDSIVESTTYEVLGVSDFDAGGQVVGAVHLRTVTEISGGSTGTVEGDLWLSRDGGLPLRWLESSSSNTPSAIGPVSHKESFTISIVSVVPQR